MKKLLSPLNIILLCAVCFIVSFYYARKNFEQNFSSDLFESEYNRYAALSEGINKIVHLPLVQGTLTSPDALFSVVSYDISEKPVGLYLPLPASPWAITIYDETCNSFYSLDERNFNADYLQVILHRKEQAAPENEDVLNITAPGKKGIIVTRLIIPDISKQPLLSELRKEMRTGIINK